MVWRKKTHVLLTFKAKWRVPVRSGCLQRSQRERSGANGNFNVTTSNARLLQISSWKRKMFQVWSGARQIPKFWAFWNGSFLHMVYGCLRWNMDVSRQSIPGICTQYLWENWQQPIMSYVYLTWWFMWLRYFSINPWCKEFLQQLYFQETWRTHKPE